MPSVPLWNGADGFSFSHISYEVLYGLFQISAADTALLPFSSAQMSLAKATTGPHSGH